MQQYLDLVQHVLTNGVDKPDRTGTGTRGVFAPQMRFDLSKEFPIVHAKKVKFDLIVSELIWLLSGDTNIEFLHDNKNTIWDEWADEKGNLGPVYGAQWRSWQHVTLKGPLGGSTTHMDGSKTYFDAKILVQKIDQIRELVNKLKSNPNDRRLIVSAWNVGQIPEMALPPCHAFFQFYVANNKLSCQLYQRSADLFLGVPFNIASYALLTHMLAQTCGFEVGEFVWTGGDTHVYHNHFTQCEEMLSRDLIMTPTLLKLNPAVTDIDDFTVADVSLENYVSHGVIKAPVAV